MTLKQFYTNIIFRPDNWYFESSLSKDKEKADRISDDYKLIASDSFGISFNSVMMLGSGKLGLSLSPTKKFRPFQIDDDKPSDIDIAIISNDIFQRYWKLFRNSYRTIYESTYNHFVLGIISWVYK